MQKDKWPRVTFSKNIFISIYLCILMGFPGGAVVNNPPANAGDIKRLGFDPWVRKIPCRRAWQPTPVFLPGECHGQRSLVGYSPWDSKESDTTEWLTLYLSVSTMVPVKISFIMSWEYVSTCILVESRGEILNIILNFWRFNNQEWKAYMTI